MYNKNMTKKISYCLLIAFLLHLLFLLSVSIKFIFTPNKIQENDPLPAYVYREEKNNPIPPTKNNSMEAKQNEPISKFGIKKSQPLQKTQRVSTERYSLSTGDQNINLMLKAPKQIDKPLLNILTKAMAAHLRYPKIAMDFRVMGTAIVGFVLSPNGEISQVTLLRSSGTKMLDEAAMSAVNEAGPLHHIESYLTEAGPFSIGFIFR